MASFSMVGSSHNLKSLSELGPSKRNYSKSRDINLDLLMEEIGEGKRD